MRQHTIPCGYLKNFSNEPERGRKANVWQYNIKTKSFVQRTVEKVGYINDFYTIIDANGNKNYVIEEFLGSNVDDGIAELVEKIEGQHNLTEKEIRSLSYFMAFQELRSNSRRERDNQGDKDMIKSFVREIISNLEEKNEQAESLERTMKMYLPLCSLKDEPLELIHKIVNGKDFEIDNKHSSIDTMLNSYKEIGKMLFVRPRMIIRAAKGRSFITSDYPIYLHGDYNSFYGVGYMTAEEIYFPLSKKIAIYMGTFDIQDEPWKFKRYSPQPVNHKLVRMINYTTCFGTNNYVIGNDKPLVESIVKYVEKSEAKYKKTLLTK